jgi:hypothetical protein
MTNQEKPYDVSQIVKSQPAYKPLVLAQLQAQTLVNDRAPLDAEIADLQQKLNAGVGGLKDKAAALLSGGPVVEDIKKSLAVLFEKRQVLDEATGMQSKKIRDLQNSLTHETRTALMPLRQVIVTRIAAALEEVRSAYFMDLSIMQDARGSGTGDIGSVSFPPISGDCAFDAGWFDARRSEGYTV